MYRQLNSLRLCRSSNDLCYNLENFVASLREAILFGEMVYKKAVTHNYTLDILLVHDFRLEDCYQVFCNIFNIQGLVCNCLVFFVYCVSEKILKRVLDLVAIFFFCVLF